VKRLTLTTVITLPDSEEPQLYRYLKVNGFGNYAKECKNTGGFTKLQSHDGIVVEVKGDITDVTEPISGQSP